MNLQSTLEAVRDWAVFFVAVSAFLAMCCILYLFGVDLVYFLSGAICFLAGLTAMRLWYAPKLNRLLSAVQYLHEITSRVRERGDISALVNPPANPPVSPPDQQPNPAIAETLAPPGYNVIAVLFSVPSSPEEAVYRIKIVGEEEYFQHRIGADTDEALFTTDPDDATLLPDAEIALRAMLRLWRQQGRELRFSLEELPRPLCVPAKSDPQG